MTFDPTTNRVPYGLLNPEEQEALRAWPHGWKFWLENFSGWCPLHNTEWVSDTVYRGKPAPVVKSTWFNVYPTSVHGSYSTREIADHNAGRNRIAVLRIDTCNGVSTVHLEGDDK